MSSDRDWPCERVITPVSRRTMLGAATRLAGALPLLGVAACIPARTPVPGAPFGPQPVAAPGFAGPGFTAAPEGSGVAIAIAMTNDLQFVPQVATIRWGQTVVWRNVSRAVHTVTFDPSLARRPGDVQLPPGVPPFTTGNVTPGQTVSFRFTVPGQYRYFCIPHELQNMVGAINVFA